MMNWYAFPQQGAVLDALPALSAEQVLVVLILVAALVGFSFGRVRHDAVALLVLLACVLTGLTPADQAFDGFGHPAVITVAAVLLISAAMKNAGVVDLIGARIASLSENRSTHLVLLVGGVTAASGFMNNVGALALLMPVAIQSARAEGRPPSMFLMPLAFGSMLGGMTTLIGTPPNIIVANLRTESGQPAFGMFDFTPVGLAIAVAGAAYLVLVGWRLVPQRESEPEDDTVFSRQDFVVEVRVPEASRLLGLSAREIQHQLPEDAKLLGVIGGDRGGAPRMSAEVDMNDVVLMRSHPETLDKMLEDGLFSLHRDGSYRALGDYDWSERQLYEFLVPWGAQVTGMTVGHLDRMVGESAEIIALAHQGRRVDHRIARQQLAAGDVLLIQGSARTLDALVDRFGLIALAKKFRTLGEPRRLVASVAIFAAAVVLTSTGLASAAVAFVMAALGLVAIRSLEPAAIYSKIDWPLIVLLGALFPLGDAMENTGLASTLTGALVAELGDVPAWAMIAGLMAVTMLLSDIINNAATALIMGPIAIRLADTLALSADPFLMAVAVGASSAFLTPIGHQSNTLVFSRGGYRFGDYWRVGLPLEVLIVLVATPMVLWVWPA